MKKTPEEMEKVSALILDLDGTLVDSSRAIVECMNYALARKGLPLTDRRTVERNIGTPLEEMFALFTDADSDELVRLYREQYGRVVLRKTCLLPGVRESLGTARDRGYRLALATTKPRYFAEPILRRLGIGSLFDAVAGGEEVSRLKPAPDLLHLAVARLGCANDEVLYVGDHPVDVAAAKAAEVKIVCVTTGFWSREELERLKPLHVAESMREVVALLPDRRSEHVDTSGSY
jgi:phosphoglycolate phosphatase